MNFRQNKVLHNRTAPHKCITLSWRTQFNSKWYTQLNRSCVTSQVLCLCQVVGMHWLCPDCCVLSEIYFLNKRDFTVSFRPYPRGSYSCHFVSQIVHTVIMHQSQSAPFLPKYCRGTISLPCTCLSPWHLKP